MGSWGIQPWDNDHAADWFGDTFDKTKLAKIVEETLRRDLNESAEKIRAASALLLLLGRVYVWPIQDLDRHLALAADRLEEMLEAELYLDAPEIKACIAEEIIELRSRIKGAPPIPQLPDPQKKWWQFFK